MRVNEKSELSWLSLAYLDAGIFLARAIVDDDFSDSEHRSRVPLFLIHQALELLYKSALLTKRGDYPRHHDLHMLQLAFAAEFPDLHFDVPDIVLGPSTRNLELFPDHPPQTIKQHERLRYPTDRSGRAWHFENQCDLADCIEDLEDLSKPVIRTWLRLRELRDAE